MPIDVFTGQPGNGKTALMMERLMAEVEKHRKGAPDARPLFAAGIDGLNVDGVTVLDDPRNWNALDEEGNPVVPDGALIFVDESWKWFGHLQEARGPTPPHVLALAEHRHRGIDFVWTTQMPNQLYPFSRGLIGSHSHVVRRFGTHFLDVFTWGELNEDVKSTTRRENAQRSTRRLPAQVFDKYKSATLHTIKRKIPFKFLALPLALLLAVGGVFGAMHMLKPKIAEGAGGSPEAASAAPGDDTATGKKERALFTTFDEYREWTTPMHPTVPWTAPAYAGRAPVSEPRVFCSLAGAGLDANGEHQAESCHCKTEQGTDYGMHVNQCRTLAMKGEAYNPFRAPTQERAPARDSGKETGREPPAVDAPTTIGVGEPTNMQQGYGAMRPST